MINRDAEAEARRVEEDREREEEKRRMEAAAALKAELRSKQKETIAQPDRIKPKTAAPPVMQVPFTFFITSVLTVPNRSHPEPLHPPVHDSRPSSDVSRKFTY